jgi:hypothetical protein
MANLKNKSFIKIKALFFICFAIALILIISANIILASNKDVLIKNLNHNLFKQVDAENIFYLPPNFIIIRKFSVSGSGDKKILSLPFSIAFFSLPEFISKKHLRIFSIYSDRAVLDPSTLADFLKDDFNRVLELLFKLPRQDFKLNLRQITAGVLENRGCPAKGNFYLRISKDKVSLSAKAGDNNLALNGKISQNLFIADNLKFKNQNIDCQLKGKLKPSLAQLQGFIILSDPASKRKDQTSIFILDIDSSIKFDFPKVEVERLNFSINNNPVRLTADVSIYPFSCILRIVSDFRSLETSKKSELKNIEFSAKLSSAAKNSLTADGKLNIDVLEHNRGSLPIDELELTLKNLLLNFNEFPILRIKAEAINLFSRTNTNTYNIDLTNFRGKLDSLNQPLRRFKFTSSFCGGLIFGKGSLKMLDFIPVVQTVAAMKDIDSNRLDGVLVHFSKTYGKLSSQMYLSSYPEPVFQGRMNIKNGYLNNFEFLKWLANLFGIPSLKKIDFNTASASFKADKEGVGMYDMNLDSKDMEIKGFFKLKEGDFVASKIFLSFRKALLQKSAKFKPLLRLLDKNQDLVKFNFQLSGKLSGMNFKWLESEFKEDLQKGIPNFAKKGFEVKISKAIESIAAEN